mgnify:CR=1 FL=1
MNHTTEIFARLYVHFTGELEELNQIISQEFTGEYQGSTITVDKVEIQGTNNFSYDQNKIKSAEEGFLHYKWTFELWQAPEHQDIDGFEKVLSQTLQLLWSKNIPTIAVYDHEQNLPEKGGYMSPNVPRP